MAVMEEEDKAGVSQNHCSRKMHIKLVYSKTCFKRPLKHRQNKDLKDRSSLNAGQKCCRMLPLGAFGNTFDLH